MKLAAVFSVWDDWDMLDHAIRNIKPCVDMVIVMASEYSNYGERSQIRPPYNDDVHAFQYWGGDIVVCRSEPVLVHAMHAETAKRNQGLAMARAMGCTHYLCCDADEMYDQAEFEAEKERFIYNPDLQGLVCASQVYFGRPDLTIGLDITLVPFIHKITPTLKHEFNRNYPFAWEGNNIRIDPTRSFNIKSGVQWSDTVMSHFSWWRKDMEAYKRKIRNSTARVNLERSNILQDLVNAKEGYFCEFYQKRLVRVPNRFNIPYGELSSQDLQSVASTDPEIKP